MDINDKMLEQINEVRALAAELLEKSRNISPAQSNWLNLLVSQISAKAESLVEFIDKIVLEEI